jgi:hypothetical protein
LRKEIQPTSSEIKPNKTWQLLVESVMPGAQLTEIPPSNCNIRINTGKDSMLYSDDSGIRASSTGTETRGSGDPFEQGVACSFPQ